MFKHVTTFGASYVESKYTSREKGFFCAKIFYESLISVLWVTVPCSDSNTVITEPEDSTPLIPTPHTGWDSKPFLLAAHHHNPSWDQA